MASKFLYGALAFVTGPIGGAVSGYYYTKRANEVQAAQGQPQTHSTFVNILTGIFLAPFSGAYYGYKLADEENKLTDIRTTQQTLRTTYAAPTNDVGASPQQAQGQWRDRIMAEAAQGTDISR